MIKKISAFLLAGLWASTVSAVEVYTYDSFAADWWNKPSLKELFENKNPNCQVNFHHFEDGITLFNRLRLEGEKTKADVIIGLDNHLLNEAEKTGLFISHQVDLKNIQLPIEWKNETFLPYDFGQFAFIYNSEKLKNPPKSLKELIEREDLKIIYQDPRTSTVGRGLLLWVNGVYGDQAESAWKQLAKHTVTVGKGWSETYGAFLKGEADLVLSYNTSPIYHQFHEKTEIYHATDFSEGGVLQIELAAKIKNKNDHCTNEFMKFLIEPETQKVIAENNTMLPVISGEISPLFDALKTQQLKTPTLPTDKITPEQQKQWVETWVNAVSQ